MIGADGNHRPKPTRPFGARASRATTYLATLSVFASCLGSLLAFNGRWRGTNVGARRPAPSPYGGTPRRPLSLRSAPFRDADGCDLDAIEEGLSKEERLSRPKRKRAPAGSKRGANGKGGEMASALPTEPTRSGSSKKRKRKRGRRPSSEMPPWLSRYERDDLSGAHHLEGEAPPGPAPFFACEHGGDNEQNALSHIQRLQLALNGIFYHPTASDATTTAGAAPTAIPYFSLQEIDEVMDSVRVASDGNLNLMSGCADFLYLMLTLEEEGMLTSDFAGSDLGGAPLGDARSIMTRDVLVAAAFHYCDCVRARKAGLYDHARRAMVAPRDMSPWLEEKKHLWLPPSTENVASDDEYSIGRERPATNSKIAPSMVSGKGRTTIERYGEESVQIATGAARLKRAEVMSAIVNSKTSQSALGNTSQRNGDADILRSFLVSLSEDWRALVIRSAACLYRLKGIVDDQGYGRPIVLSTSTMGTAREAFRVYAPLAQRLGMQRLKSELENTAFRLLYPRQYAVASTLYSGDIDAMKSIVEVLSSRIEQLLRSDPVFLDQLDDVTVSSRVKEPYSLWRKLLRYRKEMANEKRNDSGGTDKFDTGKKKFDASTLSLKLGVPDAIALRVVLSARRMSPLEDDDSLRTREKMMCYYALQLISDVWPTSAFNEAKDYIKNPKPNGYQSLHYTASLVINGEEWPFEVQQMFVDPQRRDAQYR
ncbi:hypothetical protein ACHAWF_007773 [Thalassiosira exigua]